MSSLRFPKIQSPSRKRHFIHDYLMGLTNFQEIRGCRVRGSISQNTTRRDSSVARTEPLTLSSRLPVNQFPARAPGSASGSSPRECLHFIMFSAWSNTREHRRSNCSRFFGLCQWPAVPKVLAGTISERCFGAVSLRAVSWRHLPVSQTKTFLF